MPDMVYGSAYLHQEYEADAVEPDYQFTTRSLPALSSRRPPKNVEFYNPSSDVREAFEHMRRHIYSDSSSEESTSCDVTPRQSFEDVQHDRTYVRKYTSDDGKDGQSTSHASDCTPSDTLTSESEDIMTSSNEIMTSSNELGSSLRGSFSRQLAFDQGS